MTRRGLIAPALGAFVAACSPLGLLNTLGPRDGGARRLARDLAYGDDPRQRMDLYGPAWRAGQPTLPVVVFFYGGNWSSGSKDLYGWAAQALAARGFIVALPDYRLVPQVRFPAFVEDSAAATARAAQRVGPYGGDPGRLAVAGHSAGAHMALMIALDGRFMQSAGAPRLIRAAAGLAGPYDFLPFDVPASIEAFGQAPDPSQTQPVTFVDRNDPPVWLAHGMGDDIVRPANSITLDRRLRAAGARSELKLYDGLSHADLIATFSPLFRRKAPVLDDLAAFLHRELG